MRLGRLPHEPAALVDFYQEALENMGALCERTWFDKLQIVADGPAARLWKSNGPLHEAELHFPAPDSAAPRDTEREVFPGCPLTFRLVESLCPKPLTLERAVVSETSRSRPPDAAVAEKLWHAQQPGATRWRLETPFSAAHHFSLLALLRCEIQAIDQHWSVRRLALSLPDGARDEALTQSFSFARVANADTPAQWPALGAARCRELFASALTEEMADDLASIRVRQERHLRRELERVDDYFEKYEQELVERARRSHHENTKIKADERLAATRAEHLRRRADQVQRHEIRVIPHFDALLLVAEAAWRATVAVMSHNKWATLSARFIPRSRRWVVESAGQNMGALVQ